MNKLIQISIEIIKNIGSGIPFLRHFKEKHSQKRIDKLTNIEKRFDLFEEMLNHCKKNLNIEEKIILEIGPGNSLVNGLLFLAHGAKRVYLIDRFKHLFWDNHDIVHLKKLIKKIEKKSPFPAAAISAVSFTNNSNLVAFDHGKIELRFGDAASLPFSDCSIDCIFSYAVLEHVHNIKKAINEMSRVIRHGGTVIHEVDLRDHFFSQQEPSLRLLRYPDWLWNLMSWNRPGYTNRLRAPDYIKLFKLAGFEILKYKITSKYEGNINKLKINNKFNIHSIDELKVLRFWVVAMKKA